MSLQAIRTIVLHFMQMMGNVMLMVNLQDMLRDMAAMI